MKAANIDYKALLRRKGLRLTLQRELILDALAAGDGHHTPEEIYRRVHAKAPVVNRATVYRTLEMLLELGLATTAHGTDNQLLYELADQTPHHHLVCQRCGHVAEIGHEQIAPMFDALEQEFSFQVRTDHLMLFGLCRECQPVQQRAVKR
jgi:Fur family ferric uptake transcriptional regulator